MGCILTKEAPSTQDGGNHAGSGAGGCGGEEEGPSCSTSLSAAAAISAETRAAAAQQGGQSSSKMEIGEYLSAAKRGPELMSSCGTSPSESRVLEWPPWLSAVAAEALDGWSPCDAGSFEKLCKIGTGTYSNVYKARDLRTGELVALKKVRFDNMDPESVQFMVREITLLRRLGCHPNVVGLRGIAGSRVAACGGLYLVFDYMEHDLAGLAESPDVQLSLPQIKCYMKQLLAGLDHCHSRGVLHRDIKGANLLVNNDGVLKIADFGLACAYEPSSDRPMTSRVVTLWYRAPELLLGATRYGPGVDLWSAGCVLAELLTKKPILPGRTEVDQLDKIFKLCGCPPEEYWEDLQLNKGVGETAKFGGSHWRTYKSRMREIFKDHFPPSSLPLIETLLSVDPAGRGTAADALNSQFFSTEPYPCDPASLPSYPPSKEIDIRSREEKQRRSRGGTTKRRCDTTANRVRRAAAVPATKSDVGMQINRNPWKLPPPRPISKNDKFPPPHRDGAIGATITPSQREKVIGFGPAATTTPAETSRAHHAPSSLTYYDAPTAPGGKNPGGHSAGHKTITTRKSRVAPSHSQLTSTLRKPPFGALMDIRRWVFRNHGP